MPLRASFAGRSDTGRVRARNEDAWIVSEEDGLAVVADGMGGHPGGDTASRLAADAAAGTLREAAPRAATSADNLHGPLGDAMARCVLDAHRAVRLTARETPSLDGKGTTRTALLVAPGSGRWAVGHAGDSRAYLLRGGRLEQVTRDDTWIQAEVEAGRIPPEEARGHPAAHVLRQCVGLDEPPEPRRYGGDARPGDRFLLCSDGLTDMVEDSVIQELLADADDPDEAARSLVERALEEGGKDNVTVVVVHLHEG